MSDEQQTAHAARLGLGTRLRDNVLGRARWSVLELASPGIRSAGGCVVGARSRFRLTPGARLNVGRDTIFRSDVHVMVQGMCAIGDDVFFNRWFYLSAMSTVTIGSQVRFGERVSIHDENHASTGSDYHVAAVTIGDRAWLGANVVVLPGVTIGEGAVVAAGAVVRSDVPAHALAAGVPARVVRERA